MHALCYLCKTWCLGANGVTCMILIILTSCLLFWFDNVESKLFSAAKIFIEVWISCSLYSGLWFGHSILLSKPGIGQKMVVTFKISNGCLLLEITDVMFTSFRIACIIAWNLKPVYCWINATPCVYLVFDSYWRGGRSFIWLGLALFNLISNIPIIK